MTRVKPLVSVFIQWFDLYVCLCICCYSCKPFCENYEFEYRNSKNDIGCVQVIHRHIISFDESERICMSQNGANTPIFLDKSDARHFVAFLNENAPVVQSFFYVDYQRYRVVSNEIESSSVFCFVPSVETTTEITSHQRYHHIIPDQSSEEESRCGGRALPSTDGAAPHSWPENVCRGLEENPDNYESEVDSCAPCVAAQVENAIVGVPPMVTLVATSCQNRTNTAICVRWLQEYRCTLPPELQDGEEFLDEQVRFYYDEQQERCIRYECHKDMIKKDVTNCTKQEQCLNMGVRKLCFVGVEPIDKPVPDKSKGPVHIPEGSNQVNILSESTIWIIIVGCLVIFLVMIVILLYIVNTKVDGTPLPTSLNVFEYWRNRHNFHQANFESEPVESAYNALSACEAANNSDAIPIHFDAEIRRTLSNGASSGVCYLDYRGVAAAGASQASSTCDVLGEPPPIYSDMFPDYRRHQRRIDSTPSINSMGEIPPAYTSRPVSASSSLMSVLTGAFSHSGGHFTVGGSRYASYSDMHNDDANVFKDNVPLRDSGPPPVCRDRNFSGKKVKFQPDGSLGNPRSRHASDFEATRNRRRHASDMPHSVLSSSAGANAVRNMLAPNSCQQSTDTIQKQPNLVTKAPLDLKPALRSRHRSEEQNRNYSHQGFMNGGNVRVPTIQPPPPNPSSRRRNASQDSSGNLNGNSKNNLNDTRLSSAGSSSTNITSKGPASEFGERPAKVFGPSNRHRHVSADQTLSTSSHRSRKDSDLIGLLDDQSPLILTSGGSSTQGNNGEQTSNPFSFLSKGQESAVSSGRPECVQSGSLAHHKPASPIASSDNAISSASNTNVNQNDVFGSTNQHSANTGAAEGRPRSRSVTDRSGACDWEKTQNRGGLAAAIGTIVDRTSGNATDQEGGAFRLSSLTGRLTGSLEGSSRNVSVAPTADNRVQPSFSRNGAVNASYEDESAC